MSLNNQAASPIKAWAVVNSAGTVLASFNCSSCTYGGGQGTFTFVTAMPSTNYAVLISARNTGIFIATALRFGGIKTTAAFDYITMDATGAGANIANEIYIEVLHA